MAALTGERTGWPRPPVPAGPKLDGLHHVAMTTASAQGVVRFYAGVLGLRLVKQTVDGDRPPARRVYLGDESGAPGSILTWRELRDARPGRPGAGMIHTLQLGVGCLAALDFWQARLRAAGCAARRTDATLRLRDPDGLALELVVSAPANPPLVAVHPEIPGELAIAGIQGARAYPAVTGEPDEILTRTLRFSGLGGGEYRLLGADRQFAWAYDPPPRSTGAGAAAGGAGTVDHIAWASRDDDLLAWRERLAGAGVAVGEVVDRTYFRALRFREPRGIHFELATRSPGFAVAEDPAHLGEWVGAPAGSPGRARFS